MSRRWYENGQPETEVAWVNGKEDGVSRLWLENAQLLTETTYTNDVIIELKEHGKIADNCARARQHLFDLKNAGLLGTDQYQETTAIVNDCKNETIE